MILNEHWGFSYKQTESTNKHQHPFFTLIVGTCARVDSNFFYDKNRVETTFVPRRNPRQSTVHGTKHEK